MFVLTPVTEAGGDSVGETAAETVAETVAEAVAEAVVGTASFPSAYTGNKHM